METVVQALAAYGATLSDWGVIIRNGKATGVNVVVRKGRVNFKSTGSGKLLASGPLEAASVERFVESFWFWEKS